MKSWVLAMPVLWGGSLAPCIAAVDAQAIALNCAICHQQEQARTDGGVPGFDRLSRRQLQQALLDFKYDRRQGTLMPRVAKGYSDEELGAVADHLIRQ